MRKRNLLESLPLPRLYPYVSACSLFRQNSLTRGTPFATPTNFYLFWKCQPSVPVPPDVFSPPSSEEHSFDSYFEWIPPPLFTFPRLPPEAPFDPQTGQKAAFTGTGPRPKLVFAVLSRRCAAERSLTKFSLQGEEGNPRLGPPVMVKYRPDLTNRRFVRFAPRNTPLPFLQSVYFFLSIFKKGMECCLNGIKGWRFFPRERAVR